VEFITALINSYMGSTDKIAEYVYCAKRMGIAVLPPDVNKSMARFSVEGQSIRFGLAAVRNVGNASMEGMVQEREKGGFFRDFFDFCNRVDGLNKRMLEALIFAGCFDPMGGHRAQYIAIYEKAFDAAIAAKKIRDTGQYSLFDYSSDHSSVLSDISMHLPEVPAIKNAALLAKERESTGLYLSGHPLDRFAASLSALTHSVIDLQEADGNTGIRDNANILAGGMLTSCKQKPTKSSSGMMGYANLEGITGRVEVVLFPRTLQSYASLFFEDSPVQVRGKLNIREDRGNSLLIEELKPLSEVDAVSPLMTASENPEPRLPESVWETIYLRFSTLNDENMRSVTTLLQKYPGDTPIVLYDAATKLGKLVPAELHVKACDAFISEATALLGEENVKCQ